MYGKLLRGLCVGCCLAGMFGCSGGVDEPEPPSETVEFERLLGAVVDGDTGKVGDYLDAYQGLLTLADQRGWYLIHHAAAAGNTKMIEFLVERGADPNAHTRYDETAWGVAEDHNVDPAVLELIESLGGVER